MGVRLLSTLRLIERISPPTKGAHVSLLMRKNNNSFGTHTVKTGVSLLLPLVFCAFTTPGAPPEVLAPLARAAQAALTQDRSRYHQLL